MARISKVNKYAILWLNHSGMNQDDIATELSIDLKQVSSVLEKNINVTSENSVKTKTEPVSVSKDLMIRHTASKKTNSVAIMTKEASELNDAKKNNTSAHPNIQKHIFRPNG